MCKRIMPHFQKAATQLRGQFVSEAPGARQGWLPALDFSLLLGEVAGGGERAHFKIMRRTY